MLLVSSKSEEMRQTIAVRGQVKCGFRNLVNTKVKLGIDIRFGLFFDIPQFFIFNSLIVTEFFQVR